MFTMVGLNVWVSVIVPFQGRLLLPAPLVTRLESINVFPVLSAWEDCSPNRIYKTSFVLML